ncbi:hypothetical protein BMJ32_13125 [Sinorhizobium medicae]|nr:hypothetical protein [Sinorhizobium medicae]PLU02380.1 hypothetical protein BMJ32_13125 [Sinorhizobium medicae]PLU64585.1 hypothetical protein BMJ21_22795 [Sinorhizobium medicae]
MRQDEKTVGTVVSRKRLPPLFPTHLHESKFWEALGRTVATFGFLEETLGKAIFALRATREYPESELQKAYEAWLPTLERALYEPLGGLIRSYEKAVSEHQSKSFENLDVLIADLKRVAELRNVLCHGSWRTPNESGAAMPFFVSSKMKIFDSPIDIAYLDQTRLVVVGIICSVIDSVTHMGFQFPGAIGPGTRIWESPKKEETDGIPCPPHGGVA